MTFIHGKRIENDNEIPSKTSWSQLTFGEVVVKAEFTHTDRNRYIAL